MEIKTIGITGGLGFIGSFLIDNLLDKGYKIIVFDRHYDEEKFKEYDWLGKVDFILGDLKDRESVFEFVNNCDYVVNLGGLLGTAEMLEKATEAVNVNIIGALNVFDAIKLHRKRGFQVQVGNAFMNNCYSLTKDTAARFALTYNKEFGTDIRILKMMNVFGPRQKPRPVRKIFPNVVIPSLLNKPITVYGGDQVMDMVYVKDCAEVLSRVILYDNIPNDIVYEFGAGPITINETVDLIIKLTGSESIINRMPMRPGEIPSSYVAMSDQGWRDLKLYLKYTKEDLTPMEKAMKISIAWYKEHLSDYDPNLWK